jgi:hypothetical protein
MCFDTQAKLQGSITIARQETIAEIAVHQAVVQVRDQLLGQFII